MTPEQAWDAYRGARVSGKMGPVTLWHRYADQWYGHEMTCDTCGRVKPAHDHPAGWWKRYRPKERRTERRCPECPRPR